MTKITVSSSGFKKPVKSRFSTVQKYERKPLMIQYLRNQARPISPVFVKTVRFSTFLKTRLSSDGECTTKLESWRLLPEWQPSAPTLDQLKGKDVGYFKLKRR